MINVVCDEVDGEARVDDHHVPPHHIAHIAGRPQDPFEARAHEAVEDFDVLKQDVGGGTGRARNGHAVRSPCLHIAHRHVGGRRRHVDDIVAVPRDPPVNDHVAGAAVYPVWRSRQHQLRQKKEV